MRAGPALRRVLAVTGANRLAAVARTMAEEPLALAALDRALMSVGGVDPARFGPADLDAALGRALGRVPTDGTAGRATGDGARRARAGSPPAGASSSRVWAGLTEGFGPRGSRARGPANPHGLGSPRAGDSRSEEPAGNGPPPVRSGQDGTASAPPDAAAAAIPGGRRSAAHPATDGRLPSGVDAPATGGEDGEARPDGGGVRSRGIAAEGPGAGLEHRPTSAPDATTDAPHPPRGELGRLVSLWGGPGGSGGTGGPGEGRADPSWPAATGGVGLSAPGPGGAADGGTATPATPLTPVPSIPHRLGDQAAPDPRLGLRPPVGEGLEARPPADGLEGRAPADDPLEARAQAEELEEVLDELLRREAERHGLEEAVG